MNDFEDFDDEDFDASIQRDISAAQEHKNTLKDAENIEADLIRMNNEFAIVSRGNQIVIMREVVDAVTENRDLFFLTRDYFLLLTENRLFIPPKGKPINLGKAWLAWKQRRSYGGLIFKPYSWSENKPYTGNTYNLWRGFSFEPKPGYVGLENLRFFDHVLVNICRDNKEHFDWLMAWVADIFQNPGRKIGSAVILRGARRTGKGVFARVLGKLIARHYITVTHTSQVTGRFNSHLADKILVFLDEALWAGDKEAEGPLKSLITEPTMAVEMKGKDIQHLDSYCRILMATNNEWAIPTGLNDENRFAVFDMGLNAQGKTEYFADLFRELEEGGYAALLDFFLNYKYDQNSLRKAPITDALLDQKQLSLPRHAKWLLSCLHDGYIAKDQDGYGFWPIKIEADKAYDAYLKYCETMREKFPVDKMWLVKKLKEFIYVESISADGKRWWKLPALDVCRMDFCEKLGQEIKWDD